jgi:hypothetical protein
VSALRLLVLPLVLAAGVLAAIAACNQQGNCPAKGSIQPGAACNEYQLQCEYDLATASPACDGTTTVIPSSCTCTDGAWVCPSAFDCDSGAAPSEDASASADGASEAAVADTGAGVDARADGGGGQQ